MVWCASRASKRPFVGLRASYFFGVPRSVRGAGFFIDIDSLSFSTAERGGGASSPQYLEILGRLLSALEHAIPEYFASTDTVQRAGVSAVKLLSEANRLGQKVFTVDSINIGSVLPQ